jgi:hypothetical protein
MIYEPYYRLVCKRRDNALELFSKSKVDRHKQTPEKWA